MRLDPHVSLRSQASSTCYQKAYMEVLIFLGMYPWKILETYYRLYKMVIDDLRLTPKDMAKRLGHVGRGRSPSTIYKHYQNMLEKKITKNPILVLKPFEGSQSKAFFCRKDSRDELSSTFSSLHEDKRLDYVLFLSGSCDFFITTRRDVSFDEHQLTVIEKTELFNPVFTIPQGWKRETGETLDSLLDYDFQKGTIQRTVWNTLEWDELDWKIYENMKHNGRKEFAKVAREIDVWPKTVQKRFFDHVLPHCTTGHYFFPRGYDFYDKAFLKIRSSYERNIIRALERLPCTSYVYPLGKELALTIFHNSMTNLMETMQKMEEMGIIDAYLLFVPLFYL